MRPARRGHDRRLNPTETNHRSTDHGHGHYRSAKRSREADAVGHAEVKTLHLALQGGGAHGAFAWGLQDICARKLLQRTDRQHNHHCKVLIMNGK